MTREQRESKIKGEGGRERRRGRVGGPNLNTLKAWLIFAL